MDLSPGLLQQNDSSGLMTVAQLHKRVSQLSGESDLSSLSQLKVPTRKPVCPYTRESKYPGLHMLRSADFQRMTDPNDPLSLSSQKLDVQIDTIGRSETQEYLAGLISRALTVACSRKIQMKRTESVSADILTIPRNDRVDCVRLSLALDIVRSYAEALSSELFKDFNETGSDLVRKIKHVEDMLDIRGGSIREVLMAGVNSGVMLTLNIYACCLQKYFESENVERVTEKDLPKLQHDCGQFVLQFSRFSFGAISDIFRIMLDTKPSNAAEILDIPHSPEKSNLLSCFDSKHVSFVRNSKGRFDIDLVVDSFAAAERDMLVDGAPSFGCPAKYIMPEMVKQVITAVHPFLEKAIRAITA